MIGRVVAIAAATAVVAGCGSGSASAPGPTHFADQSEASVAMEFVHRISSPNWRSALKLEAGGITSTGGSSSVEGGLHDDIVSLHVRPVGPPNIHGTSALVKLQGRSAIKENGKVAAHRMATVRVTLAMTRSGGKWRVGGVAYSQSSSLALVHQ